MIGRLVESKWHRLRGVVEEWDPYGERLCDVRVCGVWIASHTLTPVDDPSRPLPSREAAREERRLQTIRQLEGIGAQLVVERWDTWSGVSFGRGLMLQSVNSALKELRGV